MTDTEPEQPEFSLDAVRREGLLAPAGVEPAAHDGSAVRSVRVDDDA